MPKGKFIVLEGTDGSGKGVQFRRLIKKLKKEKKKIAIFDFPQYKSPSSYFVTEYLNGRYGSIDKNGPYKASIYYAVDRFDASFKIREAIDKGKIVLANRYVGSNMGHQGAKIKTLSQRKKYFNWLYNLEFEIFNIPKPDLSNLLHVPAQVAQKLVDNKKKEERAYLKGKKRDIHEIDLNHLKKAEKVYLEIVDLFPKEFKKISCMNGSILLSKDDIAEKVWQVVRKKI